MPQNGAAAGRRVEDKKRSASAEGGKTQGVPMYAGKDFDRVVYTITYKNFLEAMRSSKSIAGFSRKFAEKAWRRLVRNKWMAWGKEKPEQERNAELQHAFSQVDGFPGFEVNEFWKPVAKAVQVPQIDGVHEETGLKLPKYTESFENVCIGKKYREFLKRLDSVNGPVLDRAKAESVWKYFVQLKSKDWETKLLPDQKKRLFRDILDQCTDGHAGFYQEDIDTYWLEKTKAMSYKTMVPRQVKIEKAKSSIQKLDREESKSIEGQVRESKAKESQRKKSRPKERKQKGGSPTNSNSKLKEGKLRTLKSKVENAVEGDIKKETEESRFEAKITSKRRFLATNADEPTLKKVKAEKLSIEGKLRPKNTNSTLADARLKSKEAKSKGE